MYHSILFIGLAPSSKNEDPKRPFEGTKSWERLRGWIRTVGISSYGLANLFQQQKKPPVSLPELKNAALMIKDHIRHYKAVIALGVDVSRALDAAGIRHLMLPHPSPRNRKFNHPDFEPLMLSRLRAWLDGQLGPST